MMPSSQLPDTLFYANDNTVWNTFDVATLSSYQEIIGTSSYHCAFLWSANATIITSCYYDVMQPYRYVWHDMSVNIKLQLCLDTDI